MLRSFTPNQRLPVLLAAAVALWALVFLIAALAGFGGRYSLHPDDPSLVPALPRIDLSQARSPLETLDAYAVIGQRPLFNPDRRPVPVSGTAKSDEAPPAPPSLPLDVALTSVVMTKDMKIAIVTDNKSGRSQSVKLGNSLDGDQSGWKLVELASRKAVFEGSQGRSEAELRVFDGTGGQPPTPVAVAPPPQARPPRGSGQPPEQKQEAPEPVAVQQASSGDMTPEQRSEMIRKRIEERRRQMREEAERNNSN